MYARANWNISPARVSLLILKAISVKQKPLYENLPLNTDVAKSVSVSSSVREGEPGVPLVRPRLRSSLPPEAATWSSAILLQKNRRAPPEEHSLAALQSAKLDKLMLHIFFAHIRTVRCAIIADSQSKHIYLVVCIGGVFELLLNSTARSLGAALRSIATAKSAVGNCSLQSQSEYNGQSLW